MYKVKCLKCGKIRELKIHKEWMIGNEPFEQNCNSCSRKGKPKSEETKKKISESVKRTQTPEILEKKSEFMKKHPELWVNPQPELGHAAWKGQKHTEETKKQIGETVSRTKNLNKKENN